ncbi:HTH-type transcriptional regulator FrlR [compost metagenome]
MGSLFSDCRLPRYEQLRDHLVDQIGKGRWLPGQAISTESELAAEFEFSVGTVRKAISLLVDEGRLDKQQGRGTFVRRVSFELSLSRFFYFGLRDARGGNYKSRILSVGQRLAPSDVAQALNLSAKDKVIHIVRLRSIGLQPVLAEDIWLPYEGFHQLLDIELCAENLSLYPIYENLCSQVITSAEETLTFEVAGGERGLLLQLPEASQVVAVQRLARNWAGAPLEWRCSYGGIKNFRYRCSAGKGASIT